MEPFKAGPVFNLGSLPALAEVAIIFNISDCSDADEVNEVVRPSDMSSANADDPASKIFGLPAVALQLPPCAGTLFVLRGWDYDYEDPEDEVWGEVEEQLIDGLRGWFAASPLRRSIEVDFENWHLFSIDRRKGLSATENQSDVQ